MLCVSLDVIYKLLCLRKVTLMGNIPVAWEHETNNESKTVAMIQLTLKQISMTAKLFNFNLSAEESYLSCLESGLKTTL